MHIRSYLKIIAHSFARIMKENTLLDTCSKNYCTLWRRNINIIESNKRIIFPFNAGNDWKKDVSYSQCN
jgi:hypothetical protein